MIVNQTVVAGHRRTIRTTGDSSMKKSNRKQQQQDLSHRQKLRSSNVETVDDQSQQQQATSVKKERKKRMKKIVNELEQDIAITQSVDGRNSIGKSSLNIIISFTLFRSDGLDNVQVKNEDDLVNSCSLIDASHPMFDSIMDHNQFWQPNQIVTPTGYYLPVHSSPYDHQSNASYHLSTSDIEISNSSRQDQMSKSIDNNSNGHSRKDKSLGLLCQR